jgi:glycerophosphoryl diester phosphodiesterase
MVAFHHAVGLGFRWIETDARASADGVVMAFHDASLDRLTDRTGPIATLDARTLESARVSGEPIPTMREALETFPDRLWNIDAKSDDVVEPLLALLRELGALDRVCIGSFSHRRLARVRALTDSAVCTSASPWEVARLWMASRAPRPTPSTRVGSSGPAVAAVQVPARMELWPGSSRAALPVVDRRFVDTAHRRGVAVHVWTVDDPAEMVRLLDLGVDGLMTDRPTVLRDVLQGRGHWH